MRSRSGQRTSVLLDVDRAYFGVLRAQAVERVARATVDARQLVVDQVTALAASNLKSGLDVSFAKVNLSTAQLLLVQAENDTQRAYAALTAALGSNTATSTRSIEEPLRAPPPDDSAPLVAEALQRRPEIRAGRFNADASARFADAERSLYLPSVSVGRRHWRDAISSVRHHGPVFRARDQHQFSGHERQPVRSAACGSRRCARKPPAAAYAISRTRSHGTSAWPGSNARTSYQRLDLTNQLLDQASLALDLAQSRYDLGLSSIVELSQAQLNKTQAELEQASARYDYQVQAAALDFATGARR